MRLSVCVCVCVLCEEDWRIKVVVPEGIEEAEIVDWDAVEIWY